MNLRKLARLEKRIPALAVRALAAAQKRAVDSGHEVLVIRDGGLYRLQGSTVEFVKPVPPPVKVTTRVKYAAS